LDVIKAILQHWKANMDATGHFDAKAEWDKITQGYGAVGCRYYRLLNESC